MQELKIKNSSKVKRPLEILEQKLLTAQLLVKEQELNRLELDFSHHHHLHQDGVVDEILYHNHL